MTLVLSIFLLIASNAHADLDPRSYELISKKLATISDPETIRASVTSDDPAALSQYRKIVKKVTIDAPVETVWNQFTRLTPNQAWNGPRVNYGASYSKRDHRYYQPHETAPPFHVGQVFFNVLNFLGPKIVVGVEIVKMDDLRHEIEIAYIEGNASKGTQVLHFIADGEKTWIEHTSYYQSESRFRDAVIYPLFHGLTIGEYYRHMRARVDAVR